MKSNTTKTLRYGGSVSSFLLGGIFCFVAIFFIAYGSGYLAYRNAPGSFSAAMFLVGTITLVLSLILLCGRTVVFFDRSNNYVKKSIVFKMPGIEWNLRSTVKPLSIFTCVGLRRHRGYVHPRALQRYRDLSNFRYQ